MLLGALPYGVRTVCRWSNGRGCCSARLRRPASTQTLFRSNRPIARTIKSILLQNFREMSPLSSVLRTASIACLSTILVLNPSLRRVGYGKISQSRESNEAGLFWKCIDVYQLPAWEAAWRGGDEQAERTFPDCLLDDRCVSVLAGVDPELRIVAGVIAYEGAGVIGVTNAFGPELPPFAVIAALIKEAPLVAYERGGILSSALRRGFSAAGQLKIWTRSSEG